VTTNSYISALQTISQGNAISTSQTAHIWLTLLAILFAGWVASRVSPLPTMLVSFVLGLVLLLSCWFHYDRFNILIDVFYPLLATGMAMFVFPAVTATGRRKEDSPLLAS
jgi:ABC-type transport system involved in cytochrome c biogenesis permease subunit